MDLKKKKKDDEAAAADVNPSKAQLRAKRKKRKKQLRKQSLRDERLQAQTAAHVCTFKPVFELKLDYYSTKLDIAPDPVLLQASLSLFVFSR